MTDAEILTRLREALPHWTLREGSLCRVFTTQGWRACLMVVNAIGHLAEAAWHHPELAVSFGKVEVRLSTHSAGAITEKDFELASRIEDVVQWQPVERPGRKYINYDDI